MIKIGNWPEDPEGPATPLAAVRVLCSHRLDVPDPAKEKLAARAATIPEPTHGAAAPTTTARPQRSRNHNAAATTKVWRGRGRGRADVRGLRLPDRANVRGAAMQTRSLRSLRHASPCFPANARPIGALDSPATAPPAPDLGGCGCVAAALWLRCGCIVVAASLSLRLRCRCGCVVVVGGFRSRCAAFCLAASDRSSR